MAASGSSRGKAGYVDPARIDGRAILRPQYIDAAQSGSQSIDVKAPACLRSLSQPLDISFSGISLGHPGAAAFPLSPQCVDRERRETQHRYRCCRTARFPPWVSIGCMWWRSIIGAHRASTRPCGFLRWRRTGYGRWWVGSSALALSGLLIWGVARVGMSRQEVRLKREFSPARRADAHRARAARHAAADGAEQQDARGRRAGHGRLMPIGCGARSRSCRSGSASRSPRRPRGTELLAHDEGRREGSRRGLARG